MQSLDQSKKYGQGCNELHAEQFFDIFILMIGLDGIESWCANYHIRVLNS
jgi:hypothetical protein